jgi:hypothetical protein
VLGNLLHKALGAVASRVPALPRDPDARKCSMLHSGKRSRFVRRMFRGIDAAACWCWCSAWVDRACVSGVL